MFTLKEIHTDLVLLLEPPSASCSAMGESRQQGALAVTCVFTILAALFVAARTFSRYLGRNFGWDDWLIHLSLLLLLGQTVTLYEC